MRRRPDSLGANPSVHAALGFGCGGRMFMVARIGFSATTSRESRQGRKAAAAATMSGAGVSADAGRLPPCAARRVQGDRCATPEELRREDAPGKRPDGKR
jgi:hypothetical protein